MWRSPSQAAGSMRPSRQPTAVVSSVSQVTFIVQPSQSPSFYLHLFSDTSLSSCRSYLWGELALTFFARLVSWQQIKSPWFSNVWESLYSHSLRRIFHRVQNSRFFSFFFFPLSILNISFHGDVRFNSLFIFYRRGAPQILSRYFPSSLMFWSSNIIYVSVVISIFSLLVFWVPWICGFESEENLGQFSVPIASNIAPVSSSFSSPLGVPVTWYTFRSYPQFLAILFHVYHHPSSPLLCVFGIVSRRAHCPQPFFSRLRNQSKALFTSVTVFWSLLFIFSA